MKTRKPTLKDLVKPIDPTNPFNQPKTEPQHTPTQMVTPWKCETELDHEDYRVRNASGLTVAHCGYKEHAAYIIRAVNAHEELLEAAKGVIKNWEKNLTLPVRRLADAIRKAEGK